MPYIKQNRRKELNLSNVGDICYEDINSAGELNYVFTVIILNYLKRKGLNYQHINDIIGALEGAKSEFYRKVVASYEEIKIEENGDI